MGMRSTVARKYAYLERRRLELKRLTHREMNELYRLRAYGNPQGYYDVEVAAQEMKRKLNHWDDELRQVEEMQYMVELIWQEAYSLDDEEMDEEVQLLITEGERLLDN